ncbi:hypothetical protein H5410_040773 [Solanum commersonii]|uniref:Uncharacterized protein n=1 Tax=Solanum commersonii TaxID=4109 RepID=A0A9J5XPR5_SOLCO|nr:hypothetical protein H5410_040773 [Solanum commersonii]
MSRVALNELSNALLTMEKGKLLERKRVEVKSLLWLLKDLKLSWMVNQKGNKMEDMMRRRRSNITTREDIEDPRTYGKRCTKLLIAHIGKTVVSPKNSIDLIPLQYVYYVPCMMKNLLLVEQLTSSGHFVLFGLEDVWLYHHLEIKEK